MDWDKTLGRLAIVVPVGHVVLCTIFLFGYSWGFGSGVGTLFSAQDFFTVSLEHMLTMYVLGIGWPLFLVIYRHRAGIPYASDALAAEQDEAKRAALAESHRQMRTLILWGLIGLAVLGVLYLFLCVHYDLNRSYFVAITFVTMVLAVPYWKLCARIKFFGFPAEVTWLLICLVTGVTGLGMDDGFRDRRSPYSSFSPANYRCRGQVILTAVGDRFLSVSSDGTRHVLGDECKVVFDFPATPPLRYQSPAGAVYESLSQRFARPAPPAKPAPVKPTHR